MLSNCKYQIIIPSCPYYCCKAQDGCPPVICTKNTEECSVYKERNKQDD